MPLLTLEEWAALPEDDFRHYELAGGVLVKSPPAGSHHNLARANLMVAINRQLPRTLAATQNVEVVIDPGFPPTVRAPDVLVTGASSYHKNPPRFEAGEVLLVIEIVSPGSRTTDRVTKLSEYAQAGIPHYWVIELATLIAYNLVGGRYEIAAKGTGKMTLVEPATVTVDVSRLTELRY